MLNVIERVVAFLNQELNMMTVHHVAVFIVVVI
jgi:hypothetical protein